MIEYEKDRIQEAERQRVRETESQRDREKELEIEQMEDKNEKDLFKEEGHNKR